MIIEFLAWEPKNGNLADRKKTYQLFTTHPNLFQSASLELDHWLEVSAVNMALKTINLLVVWSIGMHQSKGDKFRERKAKKQKKNYLQEGINVGRKKGTAHPKQEETPEHAVCQRNCRQGYQPDVDCQ